MFEPLQPGLRLASKNQDCDPDDSVHELVPGACRATALLALLFFLRGFWILPLHANFE